MTITGQCHCGQIKYEAQEPIVKSSVCECSACKKATGGLTSPFVTVGYDRLTVTAGQTKIYKAEGGEDCDRFGVWHFCANCGTKVYWEPNDHAQIDLFAGTLDDRSLFQPEAPA